MDDVTRFLKITTTWEVVKLFQNTTLALTLQQCTVGSFVSHK